MAANSVTELVEAVKRPRSLSESTNRHPFMRKLGNGNDQDRNNALATGRRNSAETTYPTTVPVPPRRKSHTGIRTIPAMQLINEVPEKKQKKINAFLSWGC